jgi:Ser/Thr protein kinase RdoA (MazF antagonist)
VHYFFSTHFQPDRAKEDEFLKAYHAELERSSAMAYPWPAFRRDFDVACLDYLAAMVRACVRVAD